MPDHANRSREGKTAPLTRRSKRLITPSDRLQLYRTRRAQQPSPNPPPSLLENKLEERKKLIEETVQVILKSYEKLPAEVENKPRSSRQQPVRLLSLDGGGVRGLGTLYILQGIMKKVGKKKPCEYFDMIAGTSTGGLIAIMLGRLEMSIEDCIKHYEDLAPKIFEAGATSWFDLFFKGYRYPASQFEEAIEPIIKSELMLNNDLRCKVFVIAVTADNVNNGNPVYIRTYDPPPGNARSPVPSCTIRQACRATTAAPTYFPAMEIDNIAYQDGGLVANNPMNLLTLEALTVFGANTPIQCALSIGTGLVPKLDLRPNLTLWGLISGRLRNSLYELAINSEQTHLLASSFYDLQYPGCYFRFNPGDYLNNKEWVHEHDPELYQAMYDKTDDKYQRAMLPTAGEFEKALIALDDHKNMKRFGDICTKYITDQDARVECCVEKLRKNRW